MQEFLKILMLEDNETDAEIISRLLKKTWANCSFEIVMERESYINALEQFKPDVILSDNSMPRFSAKEALQIKQNRNLHIPFIMVTGTVSEEFAAGIIKMGADDYLLKDRLTRLPGAIDAALKQKKIEKEIADYKYALDQSSIVSITDSKGIIKYANENFCKISGYANDELLEKDHRIVRSGYHSKDFINYLWTTISKGRIWRNEFCNKAKDGSLYWVDATVVPFMNENGKPFKYLAINNDITSKKLMEQELIDQKNKEQKKIIRAILQAQEKERDYMGKELHDNVNQILAGMRMYLSMAGKDAHTKNLINYPIELLDTAIHEIRLLSARNVTPQKNIKLKDLIELLVANINNAPTIKAVLSYNVQDAELDDELKLNVYRIIQEQVNNIMRHADARNVNISAREDSGTLEVIVKDDGKGFDVNQKRDGIGIANMMSRVESFNGKMIIKSDFGQGCMISMIIPLIKNTAL